MMAPCGQALPRVGQPNAYALDRAARHAAHIAGSDAYSWCMACSQRAEVVATWSLECPICDIGFSYTETGPPWINVLSSPEAWEQAPTDRIAFDGGPKILFEAGKLMRKAQKLMRHASESDSGAAEELVGRRYDRAARLLPVAQHARRRSVELRLRGTASPIPRSG